MDKVQAAHLGRLPCGLLAPNCCQRSACPPLPVCLQVEVMANTQEDFDAWEGWVNSRMRLLIKARVLAGAARWASLLDACVAWWCPVLALPGCFGNGCLGEIAHGLLLAPGNGISLLLGLPGERLMCELARALNWRLSAVHAACVPAERGDDGGCAALAESLPPAAAAAAF